MKNANKAKNNYEIITKMTNKQKQHAEKLIFRAKQTIDDYYGEVINSPVYAMYGGRSPLVLNDPSTGAELLVTDYIFVDSEPVFVYDYANEYKTMPKPEQYLPIGKFLRLARIYAQFDFRLVYIDMAKALHANNKKPVCNIPASYICLN